jgi:nicotinamidase-related amidase
MDESNSKATNQVNANKVALLVIDVQQGLFDNPIPIYKAEELLRNINTLVDRAHRRHVPVIYVQHSGKRGLLRGSPQWQFHPRIHPLAEDMIVHKERGNAFDGTNLNETLKAMDVCEVVITGLITHGCVKGTCLGALKMGYQVTLVTDAHSNNSYQPWKVIKDMNQKMSRRRKLTLKTTAEIVFIDDMDDKYPPIG